MSKEQQILELLLELKDEASQGFKKAANAAEDYDKQVDKAQKSNSGLFGGIGGGLAKFGLMAGGITAVTGALSGVVGMGTEFVKMAAEEEVGIARLTATLEKNVGAYDVGALDAYIAKQAELAFSDDQVRDSLNLLAGQTGSLTEAQSLQAAAMDLARAKGMDLQTASKLVGKVDMDNVNILKRYGIAVTENMTSEEALAAIREQTAGQAETYAHTMAGSMETVSIAFDNAKEDIGGAIMQGIQPMLSTLAGFVSGPGFTGALQAVIGFLSGGLGAAFTFIGGVMTTLMPIFEGIWGFFTDPMVQSTITGIGTAIMDGLGAAFTFILPVFQAVWDFVQGGITAWQNFFGTIAGGGDIMSAFGTLFSDLGANIWSLVQNVGTWLMEAIPMIAGKLGEWAGAFLAWVGPMIPVFMEKLGEFIGNIISWIMENGPVIIENLMTWAQAFLGWIGTDVLPFIGEKLGQLGEFIWGWITGGGLMALITNLGTWGGAILGWIAKDVLPFLGEKLMELGTFIWTWMINDALPGIVTKLTEWGAAILNWIQKDVLPFIGGKLAELATAIWNWITTTASDLVTNIKAFATSFWTWITDVWNGIGAKLAEVATAIWNWITTEANNMITKVTAFPTAFWTWITDIVNNIGTKLAGIWTGITTWITDTVPKLVEKAKDIGGGFIKGIMDGIGGLGKALWDFISKIAGEVWSNLVNFFTGGGGQQAGPPTPPGKAIGGTVWAGHGYLVGERGPEFFIPPTTGTILPHGQTMEAIGAGASLTLNVQVTAYGAQDGRKLGDDIVDAILIRQSELSRLAQSGKLVGA